MVGLYSVAARIALLTSFFLQVTNAAISPKIAALYEEGKKYEMEKMVQSVTLGLIGIALFAVLIFVLFGKSILSIWGIEFQSAYPLLVILSIGQFFNIGTGASGLILIMCGLEKTHAWISSVFVVVNLILNYFLIREYGAVGAAIATSVTVSLDNISRVILAKVKLNIWSIPIKLK
jgi:O-antigen/teichoic acid export membrane protein